MSTRASLQIKQKDKKGGVGVGKVCELRYFNNFIKKKRVFFWMASFCYVVFPFCPTLPRFLLIEIYFVHLAREDTLHLYGGKGFYIFVLFLPAKKGRHDQSSSAVSSLPHSFWDKVCRL